MDNLAHGQHRAALGARTTTRRQALWVVGMVAKNRLGLCGHLLWH
jgi:hypothetical protein